MRVPKPLPKLPLNEDGAHELQPGLWADAQSWVASFLEHKTPTGVLYLKQEDAEMLHPTQLRLARDFSVACLNMEVYTCFTKGIREPKELFPFLGRGQFPRFTLQPLVRKTFFSTRFRCPHANFWAELEAALAWLTVSPVGSRNFYDNIIN